MNEVGDEPTCREALCEELTAINQYFLHEKVAEYIKKQSIDEMKHAEALIERILFLDGTPSMTETLEINVGVLPVRALTQSVPFPGHT